MVNIIILVCVDRIKVSVAFWALGRIEESEVSFGARIRRCGLRYWRAPHISLGIGR